MQVFILSLLLSFTVNASPLAIKAGKWRVQTEFSTNGKKNEDPMAKVQAAMKNLTPEQRRKMEEFMGKQEGAPRVGFDSKGMTVCYTEEMINNGLNLKQDQEKLNCKTTEYEQGPKRMSMRFKCDDGATGQTLWEVVDSTHMKGTTTMTSNKGNHEMKYAAEFLGPCQ